MDTNTIIETRNLTKQYGPQKSVADLSIHVKRGRIYGLLGRNGAGKTTTMKMLLGLTKPTSGEVRIWGNPLQGNEKKILPRIGGLVSRDKRAYEYLPASVGEFPAPEEFMGMMARAGFRNCRARSQSFGIAQIYIGEK